MDGFDEPGSGGFKFSNGVVHLSALWFMFEYVCRGWRALGQQRKGDLGSTIPSLCPGMISDSGRKVEELNPLLSPHPPKPSAGGLEVDENFILMLFLQRGGGSLEGVSLHYLSPTTPFL